MILAKSKHSTLIVFGSITLAAWSTLQTLLTRAGHMSDATDFVLGAVFGVGAGLSILGIWRMRRENHCETGN